MAIEIPNSGSQVEDRIKVDVQRSAPDSNPYIKTHWLRSLIAGIALRIFDFYRDLARTETRVMPDTASGDLLLRWGAIFVGSENVATGSTGRVVATGRTPGVIIPSGSTLISNGIIFITTASAVISNKVINLVSLSRSGTLVTAIAAGEHGLSSFVPVTISGADQVGYNVTDVAITVTGPTSFTYSTTSAPATPATGVIQAEFISASVPVESATYGAGTNLDQDTPVTFQTPLARVDSTAYVDSGTIGGGTDAETNDAYQARYLDKIQNPVAHYNVADIVALAKEVAGVTRVWVEEANTAVGAVTINSLTRTNNVATAVTTAAHGLSDGMAVTILGADQVEYNVPNARVIVEPPNTFHYVVSGSPVTPATGAATASTAIALGQTRVFFMRDNDVDPIPTASEVATVYAKLDTIRPANTSAVDLIVKAPTANVIDYTFTELVPDTATMRTAIVANLAQFHSEQTSVGQDDDVKAYEAAIKNTIDTETGESVQSFTLSSPVGDLVNNSGEISVLGTVVFP